MSLLGIPEHKPTLLFGRVPVTASVYEMDNGGLFVDLAVNFLVRRQVPASALGTRPPGRPGTVRDDLVAQLKAELEQHILQLCGLAPGKPA